MSKKNVLIFRGIDTYSLEESLRKWIEIFREKYGEHNISHIDGDNPKTDWKGLESEIVSTGFLSEKRLFLIRNYSIKLRKNASEDTQDLEEGQSSTKESSLLTMIETIPDDNFLILVDPVIPKTKKIAKVLDATCTIKEFKNLYDIDTWKRRFSELDEALIANVLRVYRTRDNPKDPLPFSYDIFTSLEHIYLFSQTQHITRVEDFITEEKEAVIFQFLDFVYAKKIQEAKKLFRELLKDTNIYALIGGIITNLRKCLYIKSLSKTENQKSIEEQTKSSSFIIEKSLYTAINYTELLGFFTKLVEANTLQKTGKGMQNSELGLIFYNELGLLSLQKSKKI